MSTIDLADPQDLDLSDLEWEGPRLSVRGLRVAFTPDGARRDVVHDVGFDLEPGRCVAIVGESGSGKSVTARALVGLAGQGSVVEASELRIHGADALAFASRDWRRVRGRDVGFVLQDALVSLDPLRSVGAEIDESLRVHGAGDRADRRARVLGLLARVGVPNPAVRARQRPDQLSGGLRQRALIASAIALDPDIVIADEPTTALDVTVQAQVLDAARVDEGAWGVDAADQPRPVGRRATGRSHPGDARRRGRRTGARRGAAPARSTSTRVR